MLLVPLLLMLSSLSAQSLKGVPSEFAKTLYLLYASFEEKFGLSRNAMMVYGRALKAVSNEV